MRRARRRREEALRRARKRRKRLLQAVCLGGLVALALVVSAGGSDGPGLAAVVPHPPSASDSDADRSGGGPRKSPDFDWVEPFDGEPRGVAEENEQSGTGAWKLHSARARGHIRGYVAEESVRPGQTQRIYVDAPR